MDFDDPARGSASRMAAHPTNQAHPHKQALPNQQARPSKQVHPEDSSFRERTANGPTEERAVELHQLTDRMRQEIEERTAELQKVNSALTAEVAERHKEHERLLESERLA